MTVTGTGGPEPVVITVLAVVTTPRPPTLTRVEATTTCAATHGVGTPGGTHTYRDILALAAVQKSIVRD